VLVAALALLAAPPPAGPRLRLAANQQITFHHPNISFRTACPEGANRLGLPRQLDETSGGDGIPHVCPVTGPAGTRRLSPAHTLCPGRRGTSRRRL
jgi:hypothetical protein